MNNKEIRDALASAFFDAELTVRVVYAKSTNSVYITASDGKLPYTIRIANHRASRHYSTITDYWIDTTVKNVPFRINEAIRGAAERFKRSIPEYIPPIVVAPSEEMVQNSDTYSDKPENNLIDLAQFYLNEGHFVTDNNPEKVKMNGEPLTVRKMVGTKPWDYEKESQKFAVYLAVLCAILIVSYCLIH